MVKADAYGHGAVPIARALEEAGADGFCVAAIDEALELRDGGVEAPILVLYPVPAAWAADAARLGIAVAVGDERGVTSLVGAGAALDETRPLAVELEVETGLGRGGFAEAELVAAARTLAGVPGHRPDRPVDPFPGRGGRGDHGDPDRAVRGRGPRAGRRRRRPAGPPRRGKRRPADR